MTKKRVCVVITARPSYSRIKSALDAIKAHSDLELLLVVAASAMLDRFGSAFEIIENDGFKIDARIYNVIESNNLVGQAKTTGLGIIELSNVFETMRPDCVVTIADRHETMATAIAASYLNIPLVHIQGGEVTGNIDEKVRHAITKLADLHLVSTEVAKNRVVRMGENEEMVMITGCPSIDLAKSIKESTYVLDIYGKYGGVGSKPAYSGGYIVVMQHPVTDEFELAQKQVELTLEAVYSLNIPTFWFWPNADGGSDGTSKGIRAFREKQSTPFMHFFRNMEPEDFLSLLIGSHCIVGNSSVGIRESSHLGVPAVNIGSRQAGRERGRNVKDVNYDQTEIKKAIIEQIDHGPYVQDDLYGKGNSGVQIAHCIAVTKISSSKKLAY